MSKYAVMHIKNASAGPVALYVKDPDGVEYSVTILAAGQETDQFTHLKATWELRPTSTSVKSVGAEDVLELDDAGKGGDKVIGG